MDNPLIPVNSCFLRRASMPSFPYSAYSDDTIFGWVRARSLVGDQLVFVPALAVFMNYDVQSAEEFIFPITSNGLAAGPTLAQASCAPPLRFWNATRP